jgi:hypothetical protein
MASENGIDCIDRRAEGEQSVDDVESLVPRGHHQGASQRVGRSPSEPFGDIADGAATSIPSNPSPCLDEHIDHVAHPEHSRVE